MTRVLVVEDNRNLALGLRNNLELEGYTVDVAGDGEQALQAVRETRPGLVILDLMLPGALDGFRVLRAIREEGFAMPVIVLTARGEEVEKVRGFRLGADDYVTKPFGLMELIARVAAHLRRHADSRAGNGTGASEQFAFGDVRVDAATRDVRREGAAVQLRPKEIDLLLALLRRHGRIATRTELLREVWGYDPAVVSRTVDTHVAELRRKLERDPANPRYILTVRKTGYRVAD